ncbi:hypothetical protein N9048_00450 [bacterium]|nr:hypothetical protein [bacterium]
MANIVMVTIKTAHAAVVARNPMFRQVRNSRSLGRNPVALIAKNERPIAVSTIAIKRVNSGAVESQSQRPPFSEEEERNIADEAKASRAKNLKIDSPVKAEDFGSPIVARSCPNLKSNKPACAERDNGNDHRAAA